MNTQIKQSLYNLERQFGRKVTVKKYNPCDIDFANPKHNASVQEGTIKAICLPRHSIEVNYVPNQGDYETFDRVFLIRIKQTLPFPLAVKQTFIIYGDRRYNINKLEVLEDIFYLAGCIGEPGETHE